MKTFSPGRTVLDGVRRGWRSLKPVSIASRLYAGGGLLVATVLLLSVISVVYVRDTSKLVAHLTNTVMVKVKTANDALTLLERHRRIIQSSPVRFERFDAASDRKATASILAQVRAIVDATNAFDGTDFERYIAELDKRAAYVLQLAAKGEDEPARAAIQPYDDISVELQKQVIAVRDLAINGSRAEVEVLLAKGRGLSALALAIILISMLVTAPICLALIAQVVRRIDAITVAMRGLAVNDTSIVVPSVDALDEIGDMARALRVFKRNARTLIAHSAEIERLNALFDIALNNMALGLSMFDANGRLVVANRKYRELYGLPDDLVRPGTKLVTLIEYFVARSGLDAAGRQSAIEGWHNKQMAIIASGEPFSEAHLFPDGRSVVVDIRPLADGGWVDLHKDVTQERIAEARITELATSDALTGLANRRHFLERLAETMQALPDGHSFAVLWIDLDHFKRVNDTYGHPSGDALLQAVACRITENLRATDVTARLGGDEFVVLVSGPRVEADDATALANRIIAALTLPYDILGQKLVIGASAGVVIAPGHGSDPEVLMKNADIALYRAKTQGRGTSVFYDSAFEHEISSRRQLEAELRHAVEAEELTLFYQPIVDLALGVVTGCEALMRWRHPVRGLVPPIEFIPLAEEIGLIGAMGNWAIHQACRDASAWPDHVKVAVNLSADQFDGTDIVGNVVASLEAAGIGAARLELEVTETLLLKNNAKTLEALEMLREIGVGIALDDFGTGYASLSYLNSFPFTKIKVDQSFVRGLPSQRESATIVRAVASLASALDMRTVAEGVETSEHLMLVKAAGCNEAQGYLFSRPVPAGDVLAAIVHSTALAAEAA